MVGEDSDFQLQAAKKADALRQQELDDLNAERENLPNGRQKRFLSQDKRDENDPKKKAERQREFISRLQQLLASDPAYKALYDDTFNKLKEAERQAEEAMETAILALEKAKANLQDILDSAARTSEGIRVFRDQNGQVWTEDGQLVEGEVLDEIVWGDNNPSREELLNSRKNIEKVENYIRELQSYQVNVLGHIRDRMTDERNPPQKQELEHFQEDVKNHMSAFEQKRAVVLNEEIAVQPTRIPTGDIPKL